MTDWTALDRGAAALDGRAGMIVTAADGRVLYEHDADGVYPAASVIKVPLLMALYADAANGRLSLDERLAVGEYKPGTGVLGLIRGVTELTLRDHATLMTVVSDNTATNRVIERLVVEHVAELMREWGCVRTELRRKMFDFEAADRGLDNVATARELAGLLSQLLQGQLVDRATSDAVLGVLQATCDDEAKALLRRYLPAGTRTAQKTGSLEKVRNDAAVIWADRPVVVVGLVDRVADIRSARSLLGLLGWLAYGEAGGDTGKGLPPEWPEGR